MNTTEQESSLLTFEECIQREYSMRQNLRPRAGSFVRLPARILRHFAEPHNWAAINVYALNLKEGSNFNLLQFPRRKDHRYEKDFPVSLLSRFGGNVARSAVKW
jgi:hypothetical protein